MKTNNFKISMFLLTLFFTLALTVSSAFCADGVNVKISYATTGAKFDLYKVGEIGTNGGYVLNDKFAVYSVSLDSSSAAQTLATYVQRDNITVTDSKVTGSDNTALFTNVANGVYLLIGNTVQHSSTKYIASASLFAVQGEAITITPKYETSYVSSGGGGGGGSSSGSSESTKAKEVSVLKVWKGGSSKTPVTIQLLRDGEVYSETILKETNNWRYTWKNLNRAYDWTVAEKEVPEGYNVSIDEDGTVFVITNTAEGYVEETTTQATTEAVVETSTSEISTEVADSDVSSDGRGSDGSSGKHNIDSDNPDNADEVPDDESMWGDDDSYNTYRKGEKPDEDGDDDSVTSGSGNEYKAPNEKNGGTKGKLPQTGQLWWPVPVMAVPGVLFLIIGEGIKREDRHNEED
jgi:hypothetical protein